MPPAYNNHPTLDHRLHHAAEFKRPDELQTEGMERTPADQLDSTQIYPIDPELHVEDARQQADTLAMPAEAHRENGIYPVPQSVEVQAHQLINETEAHLRYASDREANIEAAIAGPAVMAVREKWQDDQRQYGLAG